MSASPRADSGKSEHNRSGFPEWLYLVFLGFLFLTPAFDPASTASDWIMTTVIVVVSATIYMLAYLRPSLDMPAAATLILIGILGTWLGTGAMGVLPIYAAALVSRGAPRRQVIQRLAVITVVTVGSMFLSPIPLPFLLLVFLSPLPLIWVVGLSILEDVNLSAEADQLRAQNARVQYLATVTERERIARDLHDLAGQALTAVALRSQLVQRLAGNDPERVRVEAAAIETTAREMLASVRDTVTGWQQMDLEDELDKGVEALEAAGVDAEVEGDWHRDLAPSVETVLALTLREAVTNIVRHAHATSCRLSLNGASGEVIMAVTDNGIGSTASEGSGLRGMRERVAAAGGSLEKTGSPGTKLRIAIPMGGP